MKRHLPLLMAAIVAATCWPMVAQAHQPRLVSGDNIQISNPTVSQAFYDELSGAPRTYKFDVSNKLETAIQLLVPATTNPQGRYTAEIYRLEDGQRMLVGRLDGGTAQWTYFYEEFANDRYLQSAPYDFLLKEGTYEIQVTGMGNQGKYVLVVGTEEIFPPAEIWNAFIVLPKLKRTFFNESPLTLVFSVFGPYLLSALVLLNLLLWWVIFKIIKYSTPKRIRNRLEKNLGWGGRLWRLALALVLLALSIHLWNLFLFLLSGFVLYEAAVGWCATKARWRRASDGGP